MQHTDLPPITITSLDLERLLRLLETEAVQSLPGSEMLQEELSRAHVVSPEEIGPEFVTMNSTVRFVEEGAYKAYQLKLVYPDEAGTPGTVSIFAPVGSALLGLSVGQVIKWPAPGGRRLSLKIVSVVEQPESQQQYHL